MTYTRHKIERLCEARKRVPFVNPFRYFPVADFARRGEYIVMDMGDGKTLSDDTLESIPLRQLLNAKVAGNPNGGGV